MNSLSGSQAKDLPIRYFKYSDFELGRLLLDQSVSSKVKGFVGITWLRSCLFCGNLAPKFFRGSHLLVLDPKGNSYGV
jgi:hypothetical protein